MTKILELIKYSHLLYDRKYVIANDGNLSIRQKDIIIITPTGYSKGDVSENDLVFVDLHGNFDKRKMVKPSMETGMHLKFYNKNPDIKAVIHAHPVNTISYFLMNEKIDINILPEAKGNIPFIGYADYFPAGSIELANEVESKINGNEGLIILKKHGVIAYGDYLQSCFFLIERIEL
ncbi:class II aldolase/adducin family protein, partial [bacterium]|nr:class II aldolase/adducin family protein [bacterium]